MLQDKCISVHKCGNIRNGFQVEKWWTVKDSYENWSKQQQQRLAGGVFLFEYKCIKMKPVILKMMSLYSDSVHIYETTNPKQETYLIKEIHQSALMSSNVVFQPLSVCLYFCCFYPIHHRRCSVSTLHAALELNWTELDVCSTVGQNPNPADNSNETVKMNRITFSGCSSLRHLLSLFYRILISF